MRIIEELNMYEFIERMKKHPTRSEQFSTFALEKIFLYIEETFDEDYNFNPINLCSEFVEYEKNYLLADYAFLDTEDLQEIRDYIEQSQQVIYWNEENDTFIFTQD